MKPAALAESVAAGGLFAVDYENPENHVQNERLVIGFITMQTIRKLSEEGEISSYKYMKFFNAVKAFLL